MGTVANWSDYLKENTVLINEVVRTSFIAVLDTQWGNGECFTAFWQQFTHSTQSHLHCHYTALVDTLPDVASLHIDGIDCALQQEIEQQWPISIPGYHRLLLKRGHLTLTLIVGDRQKALSLLIGVFHHLFVHDIDTWTLHDVKRLGLLSQQQACCWVAQSTPEQLLWYKQAGFAVKNIKCDQVVHQIWRYTRQLSFQQAAMYDQQQRAVIIGAGLAGTCLLERLTARGWQVDLVEAHTTVAAEASGNLAGVFMPMLSKDDNPTTQLIRTAYFFAQQLWHQVGGIGHKIDGEQCGVLQVARDDEQRKAFQAALNMQDYPVTYVRYLDCDEASQRIGQTTRAGLFYPKGGWIHPPSVCRAMLSASIHHSGQYTLHLNTTVMRCAYAENEWWVYDESDALIAHAPVLVLANGMGALPMLSSSKKTLLRPIWGQVSHLDASRLPEMPVVLTGDGYLTRAYHGKISMEATYHQQTISQVNVTGHQENIQKLHQFLPDLNISPLLQAPLKGRVGVRCVTPDRLPLIGGVPTGVVTLSSQRSGKIDRQNGLYTLLGYASRGLIWSPLAAELLACQLNGEPLPINKKLWQSVDIGRFT